MNNCNRIMKKITKVPTFSVTGTVRKIWLSTICDVNMTVMEPWYCHKKGSFYNHTRPWTTETTEENIEVFSKYHKNYIVVYSSSRALNINWYNLMCNMPSLQVKHSKLAVSGFQFGNLNLFNKLQYKAGYYYFSWFFISS